MKCKVVVGVCVCVALLFFLLGWGALKAVIRKEGRKCEGMIAMPCHFRSVDISAYPMIGVKVVDCEKETNGKAGACR